MKTSKTIALALGIGADAVIAALATNAQKKVKNLTSKSSKKVVKSDDDESYAQYI